MKKQQLQPPICVIFKGGPTPTTTATHQTCANRVVPNVFTVVNSFELTI